MSSYLPILQSSYPPAALSSCPSVLMSVHKYNPSVKTIQVTYAGFKETLVSMRYKKYYENN